MFIIFNDVRVKSRSAFRAGTNAEQLLALTSFNHSGKKISIVLSSVFTRAIISVMF